MTKIELPKIEPCIVCDEPTFRKVSSDSGGGLLVGEPVCEGEEGITEHSCQKVRQAGGLVSKLLKERDELLELPLAA